MTSSRAFNRRRAPGAARGAAAVARAAGGAMVPDMAKRNTMNALMWGSIALPATAMAGSYAAFFVPKSSGGGGGGVAAKDALGNDVKAQAWLATHKPHTYELTQGLKRRPRLRSPRPQARGPRGAQGDADQGAPARPPRHA